MARQRMPQNQPVSNLMEQLARGGMEGGPQRRQMSDPDMAQQGTDAREAAILGREAGAQRAGAQGPALGNLADLQDRSNRLSTEGLLAMQDPNQVRMDPRTTMGQTTAVGTPFTGLTDVGTPFGPQGLGNQFPEQQEGPMMGSPMPPGVGEVGSGQPSSAVDPQENGPIRNNTREARNLDLLTKGLVGANQLGGGLGPPGRPEMGIGPSTLDQVNLKDTGLPRIEGSPKWFDHLSGRQRGSNFL